MITNATTDQLRQALDEVNKLYDGNVIFNRQPEPVGSRIRFTLRVKDSKGPRARLSKQGRRMTSACWHVHGDFFDTLIDLNHDIYIKTGGDKRVDYHGGNWQDWNIGSRMFPMFFSEACRCNE